MEGPDVVKAFAITLVVFAHTLRGLVTAGVMPDGGFWGEVDRTIYLFHMPLFFFLSGMFAEPVFARLGFGKFVWRGMQTMLAPLVVWSYLQTALQFAVSGSANQKWSLHDVLTAPFPPKQQFWFLWALFCISVMAGAALSLKRGRWLFGAFGFFLVALAAVGDRVGLDGISYRNFQIPYVNAALVNLPYFALGMLLPARWREASKAGGYYFAPIFLGAVALFHLEAPPTNLVFYAASIACVVSFYKIVLCLSEYTKTIENRHIKRARDFLLFLGMNSMIVYLAHIICEAGFRVFLLKLGVGDAMLHLWGGALVGLLLPLLLVPIGVAAAARWPRLASLALPVRPFHNKPL